MKYVYNKLDDVLVITFDDGHSERISSKLIDAVWKVNQIEWGKSIVLNYVSVQAMSTLVDEDYEAVAKYLEQLILSNNGEHEIAAICHVLGEDALER